MGKGWQLNSMASWMTPCRLSSCLPSPQCPARRRPPRPSGWSTARTRWSHSTRCHWWPADAPSLSRSWSSWSRENLKLLQTQSLFTFPDPVDPTHTTHVPASDLRLVVDTLRKGDLSDTSIPAMLTPSRMMETIWAVFHRASRVWDLQIMNVWKHTIIEGWPPEHTCRSRSQRREWGTWGVGNFGRKYNANRNTFYCMKEKTIFYGTMLSFPNNKRFIYIATK